MTSRHWAETGEVSLVWGMHFLVRLYLLFGHSVVRFFLWPVVVYYWLMNKQGRQASREYLNNIAPFVPELKISGRFYWSIAHFISFAEAILDKLAAWAGKISLADVEYHGRNLLFETIEKGQGVILFGSHLGNLEVCRVIASLHQEIRINVLVHTRHAEKFNGLLNRYNDKSRLNLIQVTEITSATSILLSDKIAMGELVIIAADRTPVGNRQRETSVDFLGRPACFPQGPFILASLLKCPVFTVFCLKQRGKYVIYFDQFSDRLRFPRKQRDQALQHVIQAFADRLQDYCIKEPLQWFNFYDFWRIKNDE